MSQAEKPSLAGAIALVVLGLVILVPSGLCTGVFAFGPVIEGILHPDRYGSSASPDMIIAFIIGGPFILAGGALLYFGVRRLMARRRAAVDLKQLD